MMPSQPRTQSGLTTLKLFCVAMRNTNCCLDAWQNGWNELKTNICLCPLNENETNQNAILLLLLLLCHVF